MAINVEFTEPIPTTSIGKAICNTIIFKGNELDEGKGTLKMESVIRKTNTDSTYTYFSDTSDDPVTNISNRKVNVTEILMHSYRDGTGGTITGMQVLNALSHMVEKAWANEYTMPLDGNYPFL